MNNTRQRNAGRKAPVEAVDAALTVIGRQVEDHCVALAAAPIAEWETRQVAINELIGEQCRLRFQRDSIIREFFYGKGGER